MRSKLKAPKVELITSEKVELWTNRIFSQIKKSEKKYDYVLGIREGGLNLSVPLAKKLELPHKTIRISFYKDNFTPSSEPLLEMDNFNNEPNGLLVDDLIDTGRTIKFFEKEFQKMDIAVLLWNKMNGWLRDKPRYYARLKSTNWIVFPWEQ
jgi:hypoxanthine phosphoribosyltransferase